MPKLLIFDAFTLLICEKNVVNYSLLRCKTFSLKIWVCKIFDKFHVWQQWQCAGLIGTIVFELTIKFVIFWHYFVSVTNVAFWDPSHGKRLLARKCVKISIFAWTKTLHLAENWIFICSRRVHSSQWHGPKYFYSFWDFLLYCVF